MSGFWDEETFIEFEHAIHERIARSGQRADHGGRVILNLSDFSVQSTNVVDRIVALIGVVERRIGRFAIVSSGSALQRMQLDRIFPMARTRTFTSDVEAMAWLDMAVA